MKSPDILATECAREFEAWCEEMRAEMPTESIRQAFERARYGLLRAFVAGYSAGGRAGAKMMHEEAVRVAKGETTC